MKLWDLTKILDRDLLADYTNVAVRQDEDGTLWLYVELANVEEYADKTIKAVIIPTAYGETAVKWNGRPGGSTYLPSHVFYIKNAKAFEIGAFTDEKSMELFEQIRLKIPS